jgi:undecaprenyl diphosphate synthase
VQAEMDRTIDMTAGHTGLNLCLAINYGARGEIVDAVRSLAGDVKAGRVDPDAVDEETIAARLYTAGMPDPDLLVRTAGEMRFSNYLLWQVSYAEFYVTEVCWPEFREAELHAAIREFAARNRKFGGLNTSDLTP